MALNIRNTETERLAAELAQLTGRTKTDAVAEAIRDRLERLQKERSGRSLADQLDDIGRRCAELPVLDERPADVILGYDSHGVPR
ncbi:MAG: type II toxin-antitoxin system VapB family antitoxin [Gammaproteobacteria bacterium]|nr:type II toxin-antitoxin system VapB family antitoxin [Gammaproteobacteria bacterium]